MITSYILVILSGIGIILIGINHYLNIWATHHITLDLFVSIIFIATQTLVIFFFVGTGVKRKLYPPTLMVTILFMIMVILDGGFFLGKVKEWWFHIVYVLTLYYYTKATGAQHKAFIGSTNIVLAMTKTERQEKEQENLPL